MEERRAVLAVSKRKPNLMVKTSLDLYCIGKKMGGKAQIF